MQPRGKNKTSIIYSKDIGNGTIYYVEKVFETSRKQKPRLTIKTAWVKVAAARSKPSTSSISTAYRNSSVLFANGRVKPDSASNVLDVNGEPLVVYRGDLPQKESFATANVFMTMN